MWMRSSGKSRNSVRLRHELTVEGKRVRPRAIDLMIAATAIESNLVLVTRNRSDYADIPGLAMH